MKKLSIFLMMLCLACFGVAKAQTTVLSENFDNMTEIATSYSANDWYAYNAGSANNWTLTTNSSNAYSGSKFARYGYSSSYDADCYLVSAPFSVSSKMTELEVSLYEKTGSYTETFEVFFVKASDVVDDASIVSATHYSAIASADYNNTTYAEVSGSVTSSALVGQSVRVVVHCTSEADMYWLGIDDITVTQISADDCVAPRNLDVTSDGTTATVTWDGTAANDFIIDINGTQTTGVTSPYTFDVQLSTTYAISVMADCGEGNTSDPVSTTLNTPSCLPADMCSITLALTDSYGDGWNGGKMEVVDATTGQVYGTYTISSGGSAEYDLALCPGTVVNFVYTAGSYGTENGWVIYDAAGEVITEEAGCNSGCGHTNGVQATYTMECPSCIKPSDLQASDITTNSATLSWTGSSDSYMLQYSPWSPTGDDVLPTGTLQPYTFDLSQFSGTGAIVIRHYDVTNMFRLNIDDIVVLDADGEVVYSQDFEDCGGVMPSEFTMMDMDGDGQNWYVVTSGKINGNYGLSSASWNGDALTPDNWLVLSGIELGGSITFYACGQDASFPAENFNVYVCPENAMVETAVNGTSFAVTGLQPYTPVAWQVKGICGEEETAYASSFFTTLDDILIFGTEGNWDELGNWTDVNGNAITVLPTIDNKVRIDEDVTIPAGVVAAAKKATLNGGTITIADGGQLKLDATVEVTMEKEIAGYGEGDANWYFIASPLTTTRLTYVADWSYVNALTGTYDLYTFDPTQDLEWINYKANSSHANFTSGENNPVFVSMNGYLYGHEDDHTLQFQGSTAYKSYNNVETVEYTYDATSEDEWNGYALVGNPYTCNAYVNYVDADGIALEADFYTLNNDNTYTLVSSNMPLAPCTGAFINYSATGTIQFASEAPAKVNRTGMINMNLSRGNKTVDQARVRFGQGHNLQHMSFRNSSKLYMPVENNDYAVVYTENQGEMPVNFKAEENGTYTISFNTENVEFGYLHLIDNMTGADVDLLSTPSYSFEARTTDYASRFKLVFATGNADDNFAFFSNGNFVINNEGMATVQVIDINGRIMSSETINGCANVNVNAAAGVYMIRLINGENVKVQKVVVR